MRQPSIFTCIGHFLTVSILAALLIGPVQLACSGQSDQSGAPELADELKTFLDEIQQASDQVSSFSAQFIQERRLALFAQPVIFHGQLTVVRPDRLRWEFRSPIPSVLIFNGDKGLRCNDQAPPVQFSLGSDPVMRTVAEQLWLWLGGDYAKINDLYHMGKKGQSSLVIRPKEQSVSEFIGAVTITFSQESRQPELVEILEPEGDSTHISFHSYQLNSDLSDDLFSRCAGDE